MGNVKIWGFKMTDSGSENGQDIQLDALFIDAQQNPPVPSDVLMARIAAQGRALQPNVVPSRPAQSVVARSRGRAWLMGFFMGGALGAGLGGAGLAAAGLVGLWVGLNPPAPLAGLGEALWQNGPISLVDQELADLIDGPQLDLGEG